jgi:hypothetical protein
LFIVALFTTVLIIGAIFYKGSYVFVTPEGVLFGREVTTMPGVIPISSVGIRYRIGGAFAIFTQMTPAILVLANLRGLFRLYTKGTVFAHENAQRIKRIGIWLIVYAVAPFISVMLLTLADSAIDRRWFHLDEVQALLIGIILFVISQVMEVGREIEQERDEFI